MKIQVLLFAQLREYFNTHKIEYEISSQTTLQDIQNFLINQTPSAKEVIESSRFALNQTYTKDLNQVLKETDELALIPPVSGG